MYFSEDPVLVALVVLVPGMLGKRLGLHGSPGRQVLEQALAEARVPSIQQKVVIERAVSINPLTGIKRQEFVNQITGVLVLHVMLESLLDPPLHSSWDLDFSPLLNRSMDSTLDHTSGLVSRTAG